MGTGPSSHQRCDIRRERHDPAGLKTDMQQHDLLLRHYGPVRFPPHLMREVNALGVRANNLRVDLHAVANKQFGAIQDVGLGGEGAVPGAPAIRFAQAKRRPDMVDRAVEHDDVISHVHMVVFVDPLRPNNGTVAPERRRERVKGRSSAATPPVRCHSLGVVVEAAGVKPATTAAERIAATLVVVGVLRAAEA